MGESMKARLIKWVRKHHRMSEAEARQYYNSRSPEQKRKAALQMQEGTDRVREHQAEKRDRSET